MANPELIKRLVSGVEKWNVWKQDSIGRILEETEFDLRKANLYGLNLSGFDLRETDLFRADLSKADLTGADLFGADLSFANLRKANLSEANLDKATLSFANLRKANLSEANLDKATLSFANLRKANLSEANLRKATLNEADLSEANLRGVNLSEAHLCETDLFRADLSKADLSRSEVDETAFIATNLSATNGLDKLRFRGPCPVDHRTLEQRPDLPISFLRGCGLSDVFIDFIPSIFSGGIEFFSCFISHSSADKKFAKRLHDGLQSRGVRCWLDEYDILPGDDPLLMIDEGIKRYDKVLLICSAYSLDDQTGWWVQREIDRAFMKERELQRQKGENVTTLIPVNLDGFLFSRKCAHRCKADFQARHEADFRGWEKDHNRFDAELEKVILALRADKGARKPTPKPKE